MVTPNRQCEVCAQTFYASPGHVALGWGRFCSQACSGIGHRGAGNGRWQGTAGDSQCLSCGALFHRKPSQLRKYDDHYCSKQCQLVATKNRQDLPCERCGKLTTRSTSQVRGARLFCSVACRSSDKTERGRISFTCRVCDSPFSLKQSEVLRNKPGAGSFCSIQCKARYMSSSQLTTGGVNRNTAKRGGRRDDLGIYVRSSWEANWARYLNWLQGHGEIMGWEYEPITFEFTAIKKGTRFYTPDFRVTFRSGEVEYHEVKGWMDERSATKLARMARYYPETRIVLVEKDRYYTVARQMRPLIPTWEHYG